MALETFGFIDSLVDTNPGSADPKSQGDDHLRGIKSTLLDTFPGVTGAITATQTELNILDGATLSTAEINILDGATLSTAELNILDGATLSTTELNYVDGVTSAIQNQLDLKAPLSSPAFTDTPTAPTASAGSSGTQIATLDFVNATGFSSVLPAQTGNAGKMLNTDGTNASWTTTLDNTVISPASGTSFATTTVAQTLIDKTLQTPIFQDSTSTTKKANLVLSGITAGQNRSMTLADENMTLFTPGWRLLSTVAASGAATVDIENAFSSTYDAYVILASGFTVASTGQVYMRMKIAGSYISTADYSYRLTDDTTTSGGTYINLFSSVASTATIVSALEIYIPVPHNTSVYKSVWIKGMSVSSTMTPPKMGYLSDARALQGIRIIAAGNITGNFYLFGIRKA